ncbi:MAG TPA: VTT domain-containing protein [Rhodopila sp.]
MTLSGLLTGHGGALILPLAVIEGPLVAIVAGFLAARGYFTWYWALLLLVCGDLIGDMLYYWIGRSGMTPLTLLRRRLGMQGTLRPALRDGLRHNAARMLFVGKWTHGVGCLVLIASGMLRLPLRRFLMVNLLATLPKSAALFGFGYFAGDRYVILEDRGGLVPGLAAAVTFAAGVACIVLILRRTDGIRAGR